MSDADLTPKAREALKHIRTAVMRFGKVPSVRELMFSMNYKSPRSTMLLMEELRVNGFLEQKDNGTYRLIKDIESVGRTVSVPLVGTAACGTPLLAEQNIEALIPVAVSLAKAGSQYFILQAKGDSMDLAGINDGDLVLVLQQFTADNGQTVVALIDDEATIKIFQRAGDIIKLIPKSTNRMHQPIILDQDFQIQGIVVTPIPNK